MHSPQPVELDVDSPTLDRDIRDFKGGQNDCGLVVVSGTLAGTTRQNIIALASRHSLPAIYPNRCYVTAGGLLSYGAYLPDFYAADGSSARRYLVTGLLTPDVDISQISNATARFEDGVNLQTANALSAALGNVIYNNATTLARKPGTYVVR